MFVVTVVGVVFTGADIFSKDIIENTTHPVPGRKIVSGSHITYSGLYLYIVLAGASRLKRLTITVQFPPSESI